jgi:hypothetical protein
VKEELWQEQQGSRGARVEKTVVDATDAIEKRF